MFRKIAFALVTSSLIASPVFAQTGAATTSTAPKAVTAPIGGNAKVNTPAATVTAGGSAQVTTPSAGTKVTTVKKGKKHSALRSHRKHVVHAKAHIRAQHVRHVAHKVHGKHFAKAKIAKKRIMHRV